MRELVAARAAVLMWQAGGRPFTISSMCRQDGIEVPDVAPFLAAAVDGWDVVLPVFLLKPPTGCLS
jgi:hypothetical protein